VTDEHVRTALAELRNAGDDLTQTLLGADVRAAPRPE
jgi:hypothetical protein